MRYLSLAVLCTFMLGCGSKAYDGDKRFAVSGNVTFDGEPVDGGIIRFVSESASGKERVSGGVITAGKYSVDEGQGPNAGKYQVEIRWSKPTGKQVKDTQDTGAMIDVVKEAIPSKFNEVTELRAEVSGTKTKFDFDLKSK